MDQSPNPEESSPESIQIWGNAPIQSIAGKSNPSLESPKSIRLSKAISLLCSTVHEQGRVYNFPGLALPRWANQATNFSYEGHFPCCSTLLINKLSTDSRTDDPAEGGNWFREVPTRIICRWRCPYYRMSVSNKLRHHSLEVWGRFSRGVFHFISSLVVQPLEVNQKLFLCSVIIEIGLKEPSDNSMWVERTKHYLPTNTKYRNLS